MWPWTYIWRTYLWRGGGATGCNVGLVIHEHADNVLQLLALLPHAGYDFSALRLEHPTASQRHRRGQPLNSKTSRCSGGLVSLKLAWRPIEQLRPALTV